MGGLVAFFSRQNGREAQFQNVDTLDMTVSELGRRLKGSVLWTYLIA